MRVLVIGPSPTRSKGGMATVISEIAGDKELCRKYNINIYESYIDGGLIIRTIYSIYHRREPAGYGTNSDRR